MSSRETGTVCAELTMPSLCEAKVVKKPRGRIVSHQTASKKKRNPANLGNRDGFTIVELLAALLLFGIGLVALAQSLPRGMEVRDRGRRMTVATQLAREQVETLRSLPFSDSDLSAGAHVNDEVLFNGRYHCSWTVQENTPIQDMKRIEVRVSFVTSSPDSEAVIVTQRTR